MGNSNSTTDNNINDIESYKNRIHLLEEKNNILQNEIDEIKKMINETYKTEYEEKFKLIFDTFGDIKSNIETISNKKKNKNLKSEPSESSKSESEKSDEEINEHIKEEIKEISKKKKSSTKREPIGFTKPVKLSDELSDFINVERGTKLGRNEVSRHIMQYIKNNGLQDKINQRTINPDEKLKALIKIKPDETLTYFNLQRYLSPHFLKN